MSVTATESISSGAARESGPVATSLTWVALVAAVAGLAGSLSLSWALHLKPCPLCFYQRTFMMALVAILGVGLGAQAARPGRLSLLALPLAVAGLGVALFHVWLESTGKLECPQGLLGLGTAPTQSLVMFTLLSVLLLAGAVTGGPWGAGTWGGLAGGVVLGVLLAIASCTSNPPMPPAPKAADAGPPDVCRPPFIQPGGEP
jgi:hypothetical protein